MVDVVAGREGTPEERLRYLDCMDQVSRIIYQSEDPELAIQSIMSTLLATFQVDRAGLLYPLDHGAGVCTVPYEATTPEFPGACALAVKLPVDQDMKSIFDRLLTDAAPEVVGLLACDAWPAAASFGVKSLLCMALRPRADRPWALLLHQCTHERTWSPGEVRLFRDIGLRLTEALTHLFLVRRLRALARAVEEAEAQFHVAADTARMGMLLVAPGDRLLFANRALGTLLGRSREEILAHGLSDLVPPEAQAEVRSFLAAGFRGAERPPPPVAELVARDGTLVPVEVSATVMTWRGEVVALLGFTDLRPERALERERSELLRREQAARAEAEHLSQAKDLFMAVFSHELRNPLTTVLSWAELLHSGKIPGDQQELAFRRISQGARSLSFLLNDLADFSRAVLGKLELNREPVSLPELIEACAGDLEPLAAQKSVAVRVDIVPGLPAVSLDRERTRQVLWNLLANALKFTPQGGRIEVRAGSVPGAPHLEVSVTDTGIGIAPEFLPHVFDIYSQEGRYPGGRVSGGLGLGLAVSRRLVELHGGTITAESPGVDHGATFRIRFPR
jgi:PAS domain S-box-containing protein